MSYQAAYSGSPSVAILEARLQQRLLLLGHRHGEGILNGGELSYPTCGATNRRCNIKLVEVIEVRTR